MTLLEKQRLFKSNKASALFGRYITNDTIAPLLKHLNAYVKINNIGKSALGDDINAITLGEGEKRVLLWSQMHGNESTTTKALFDFINTCINNPNQVSRILKHCTLYVIPILNPDGAKAYTRVNANKIDLNRDAQQLSQPESIVLRNVFNTFKPHYCFNLHGQRTIFSAGKENKSAIVSFLSPAQDKDCTITDARKVGMEIIAEMNIQLQQIIPNHVGTYDDAFNINCVGDTFQSENIPTVLFEAGHYPDDYQREKTRELIYISYLTALNYIANNRVDGAKYKRYFDIPENEKLFFDIIIRKAKVNEYGKELVDLAIQFEERLIGEVLDFIPVLKKIEDLSSYYGHREIDANGYVVSGNGVNKLQLESEIDFVMIKNEKITLNLK